jgi:hypothetical protein
VYEFYKFHHLIWYEQATRFFKSGTCFLWRKYINEEDDEELFYPIPENLEHLACAADDFVIERHNLSTLKLFKSTTLNKLLTSGITFESVTKFEMITDYIKLPDQNNFNSTFSNITVMVFDSNLTINKHRIQHLDLSILPPNLENLHVSKFELCGKICLTNLKILTIELCKYLFFGSDNEPIILPESLKIFGIQNWIMYDVNFYVSQLLEYDNFVLPSGLKCLSFDRTGCPNVIKSLPPTLEILIEKRVKLLNLFTCEQEQIIINRSLFDTTKATVITHDTSVAIECDLPSSLKYLVLSRKLKCNLNLPNVVTLMCEWRTLSSILVLTKNSLPALERLYLDSYTARTDYGHNVDNRKTKIVNYYMKNSKCFSPKLTFYTTIVSCCARIFYPQKSKLKHLRLDIAIDKYHKCTQQWTIPFAVKYCVCDTNSSGDKICFCHYEKEKLETYCYNLTVNTFSARIEYYFGSRPNYQNLILTRKIESHN